jgi:hypothetical protein
MAWRRFAINYSEAKPNLPLDAMLLCGRSPNYEQMNLNQAFTFKIHGTGILGGLSDFWLSFFGFFHNLLYVK